MKIPAVFQPYVEIFQAIDGHGQLWSPSGQFLGRLASDSYQINSLINPRGDYGSCYSQTSIHNPECDYGGDKGQYSPFNPSCKNPPVVFYRSQPLFVLTCNLRLYTNGLKIIDPYLTLAIYEALSGIVPDAVPERPSKLIHSWATPEQLQSKLSLLSGSAFKAPPGSSSLLQKQQQSSSTQTQPNSHHRKPSTDTPNWLTKTQELRVAHMMG